MFEVLFRDHSYFSITDYLTFYLLGAFVISVFLTFIAYAITYGFAGKSFAEASLAVYNTVTETEKIVVETVDESISEIIEIFCDDMSVEQCNQLRIMESSLKTAKEVADLADQIKKSSDIVETVSK
ncbi:hypothetical protein H6504_05580 [Candidatus Woesearchaeota archaeon]|nr:hypothetical protein [Candidatus Woesearchaeota archaeon]